MVNDASRLVVNSATLELIENLVRQLHSHLMSEYLEVEHGFLSHLEDWDHSSQSYRAQRESLDRLLVQREELLAKLDGAVRRVGNLREAAEDTEAAAFAIVMEGYA